jgi:hypothetical protein
MAEPEAHAKGGGVVKEEAVLDTRELKAKLLTDLPGEDHYNSFRRFVAGRLPPELMAVGIPMLLMLACHDIETGVDGFTGKALNHRLTGMPSTMFAAMNLRILCEFPEPFQTEARRILADG